MVDQPKTRVTPAGLAVSRFLLDHFSEQPDGEGTRQLQLRVSVQVRGEHLQATTSALQAGAAVRVLGYLGQSGYRPHQQQQLVVVARRIELLTNSEMQGVE